jgi:hypothetical protein
MIATQFGATVATSMTARMLKTRLDASCVSDRKKTVLPSLLFLVMKTTLFTSITIVLLSNDTLAPTTITSTHLIIHPLLSLTIQFRSKTFLVRHLDLHNQ